MRSPDSIELLSKWFSPPESHHAFLSDEERLDILSLYENAHHVTHKITGPSVVKVHEHEIQHVVNKIRALYGNVGIRNAHIFDVTKPHVMHIDDDKDLPNNIYKAFLFPLWMETPADINMVFFEQHYFGGPVKFFKGRKNAPVHYNVPLTDYTEVHGLKDTIGPIDDSDLTHLKPQWLEGMSIDCKVPWRLNDMIAFDALQVHCSSDFRPNRKMGLSIFTTLNP